MAGQTKRSIVFCVGGALIAVALAGCLGPRPQSPTQPPAAEFTRAAQTIVAEFTQRAGEATPAQPEGTDLPPSLSTATATQSPTDTPLPTFTATSQPATESPTQTAGATPDTRPPDITPVSAFELVYEDDFSNDDLWYTAEGDDFSFSYEGEAYRITNNLRSASIWSIRDEEYDDVVLEVDAAQLDGPEDAYYGLVCRHQDEDNFYALVIGGSGMAAILRMQDGELEFLIEGSVEGVIDTGDRSNRVRADCIGDRLTLYTNGQKLLETQDETFDTGVVGLVAGTRREPGAEVEFDNLGIYIP